METIIMSDNTDLPFAKDGCVMALGFFDGVHLAHRALIKEARCLADEYSLPLVIFTFPAEENRLKPGAPRLYSTEMKLELLSECGADYILLADFKSMMNMEKEEFIESFLIGHCSVRAAVCGYNFHYGHGKSGDAESLKNALSSRGLITKIIDEYKFDGAPLSTTYIRALLDNHEIENAALALGKPYFIYGKVTHGNGQGRSFGLPTINIPLSQERYLPKKGVYASLADIDGKIYKSLTNIGTCPTFGERDVHAETFILDFDGNLYGENVRVYLCKFIRDEKAFSSEKELIMQINIDKKEAIALNVRHYGRSLD